MRTTTELIAELGANGVYVQRGASNCRRCSTFAEPFWRVQGSNDKTSIAFAGVDSAEKAREMLPVMQAENPGLTTWEIIRFEPAQLLSIEPIDEAAP